jgi:hypothetical protein
VAGQWLRSHVPSGEGAPLAAFVAGELAAREDVAAQESREAWPDVWDAARRAKLRRWM